MSTLFRREIVTEIESYLPTDDVIVILGARQVGKTSILMVLQDIIITAGLPTVYLDLEDSRLVDMLDKGVDEFLTYLTVNGFDLKALQSSEKKLYVLLDEIQYLANPSSFMKLIADHHRYLKLIVSGSSSFEMRSKFKNSLVGRTVSFEIFPLSFKEFLLFKNEPFIPVDHYSEFTRSRLQTLYREYALYGGYPKIVLTPERQLKERYLQQIIDTYIRKDIRDLAEIKDIGKFNRLIELFASQSGGLLNIAEVCNTIGLVRETVERYLFLLEQTYILRLIRPFSRNKRAELTKTPKVYFFDTGLMQMLWMKQIQSELTGTVFETSIFSELVKRFGMGPIHFWRTTDQREIDFVVRLPDKTLSLEAKLQFPLRIPTVLGSVEKDSAMGVSQIVKPRLVGLNGQPHSPDMIFPWQL